MNLKQIREENNLSQKEVASFLSVRQNTYSQYETGKRYPPPVDALIKLAKFYRVTTDYILDLED